MTNWKKIKANTNLIQHQTERSILIKLPKSEFKFWHPKKLCQIYGKNNYILTISYTEDFKFKIFRNGNGKFNQKEILEEKELSYKEFEKYFDVSEN